MFMVWRRLFKVGAIQRPTVNRNSLGIETLESRTLPSGIPLDFGNAPLPYPGALADDGARHVITLGGPTLGDTIGEEADIQPSDDADGVHFLTPLIGAA